jgi:hypothetical protein
MTENANAALNQTRHVLLMTEDESYGISNKGYTINFNKD